MTTAARALPRLRRRSREGARTDTRSFPVENTLVWVGSFAFYLAVAAFFVFHLHYTINDALTRVDNAFNVLFSRDPHLGAIGFVWPPLPSFVELPIIAFKGLWPPLVTQGFAGSIEAAAFSAGTVALLNSGLRWAGVVRGMRAVICLIWMLNPMVVIFATQGMSEASFVFFFVASILVFLRWCDSNKTSLLPLAGILAGGAALCRVEALLIVFVMGYGVVIQSIQNGAKWRQVENQGLLYALPAAFVVGLWLVSAAIIFRDPLYLLHANGIVPGVATSANAGATSAHAVATSAHAVATAAVAAVTHGGGVAQTAHAASAILNVGAYGLVAAHGAHPATGIPNASAYGLVQISSWKDAAAAVFTHILDIYPAVVVFYVLLGIRVVTRKGRVGGVTLAVLGLTIPAFDILLLRSGSAPLLRYQISVIPLAFLIAIFVLRSLRGRYALISSWIGLGMAVVLALSSLITAQTLANPKLAEEEAPVIHALASGRPVVAGGDYSAGSVAAQIDAQLLRLDWDRGLILCDSATCFSLNMAAPDPKLFVVTSDRDFEAAAAAPLAYHVEYFLVPKPEGSGSIDRLNRLYTTLWKNGGGFAVLVGQGRGGGPEQNWRLYRITGETPRLLPVPSG